MNFIPDKNYGIDEDEIRAVDHMQSEYEEEHERDIKDIIQDDDYKSPWKNKDVTVATGLKTVTYSSDSDKKPAVRNEPIKDTQTLKELIKRFHLGKNSLSFRRWTHRHGPNCHRIWYHWRRRISDY